MHYYILFSFFFLRLLLLNKIKLSRCCAVPMYDILIYVLKAWTQKQDREKLRIKPVEVVTTSRKTPHLVFLVFSSVETIDSI